MGKVKDKMTREQSWGVVLKLYGGKELGDDVYTARVEKGSTEGI